MRTTIKAKFKGMNTTADRAVLQFVVDEGSEAMLPELLNYSKKSVFVDVDDGQPGIFDAPGTAAPAEDVEDAEWEIPPSAMLPEAV